jgi:hypothetical protein
MRAAGESLPDAQIFEVKWSGRAHVPFPGIIGLHHGSKNRFKTLAVIREPPSSTNNELT